MGTNTQKNRELNQIMGEWVNHSLITSMHVEELAQCTRVTHLFARPSFPSNFPVPVPGDPPFSSRECECVDCSPPRLSPSQASTTDCCNTSSASESRSGDSFKPPPLLKSAGLLTVGGRSRFGGGDLMDGMTSSPIVDRRRIPVGSLEGYGDTAAEALRCWKRKRVSRRVAIRFAFSSTNERVYRRRRCRT
jgi:hypothetical protein